MINQLKKITPLRKFVVRVRAHKRQLVHELFREPLNQGKRAQFFRNYISWHLFHKHLGRRWIVQFDNGYQSYVYSYPDHDAGEVNIWTRNVDWYDIRLIREVISPGDFVVDAGCNVGNRTLAIADLAKGALLIDAGKTAVDRTRENIQLNNLDPTAFQVVHKAVGSKCGSVEFTNLGGASTLNRVVDSSESGDVETVTIEMTTLDKELNRIGQSPSFIKVDVEGQDLEVLKGTANTIRSGCVKLIKFERNKSEPLEPIKEFFEGFEWGVFALNDKGLITEDKNAINKNMNLFAAPKNLIPEYSKTIGAC